MSDTPKNFRKFKKVPLFIAVGFLALSVMLLLFVYKEMKENEALTEGANMEWQKENMRREELRSLERSLREIQNEKNLVEARFAQSSNVVPFLDSLESLAKESGARSEVVSVDIAKESEELLISLKTKGSFDATYKFIRLLETSPYYIKISSFDIERPRGGEEQTAAREWTGFFSVRLISFVK